MLCGLAYRRRVEHCRQRDLDLRVLVVDDLGHRLDGGPDRLADENIFNKTDVPFLTNAGRLPVFLAMTCSSGNFAIPGFPSLSEALAGLQELELDDEPPEEPEPPAMMVTPRKIAIGSTPSWLQKVASSYEPRMLV